MFLSNNKIFKYNLELNNTSFENQEFPAKVLFYIQKNQNMLSQLAEEIETCRISILKQYGDLSEDRTQYVLREDTRDIAQKKLIELSRIEQDVDIKMIKLDDLEGISLTKAQMEALMFMIEE